MPILCRLRPHGAVLALLPALGVLAACASPLPQVSAAAVPSVSPGQGRIWFYREVEPSVSLNLANVMLNGTYAGSVQYDGTAFYRDVPPGHYHISVESYGRDANQDKDVDLHPGQEVFAKIAALSAWENSGDHGSYTRDTFYVYLIAPERARAELATHPVRVGG